MSDREPALISINDLKVHFPVGVRRLFGRSRKVVKAVDGVSLDISQGETMGLVGESGCGKTTLGRAILKLIDPTSGEIIFRGRDLAQLSNTEMRAHRRHLQVIFQDPYASLNPRMTVSQIIGEPLETFGLAAGEAGNSEFRN
jgi:ABC-type microcin C transport system duplicated ATPase subunit YejF